jgi:hypothetical protein
MTVRLGYNVGHVDAGCFDLAGLPVARHDCDLELPE